MARTQSGNTLIGMLVAVAIVAVLAVVFLGGGGKGASPLSVGESTRADGKGRTVLGAAKAAAQDDVCRSNLSQVRMAVGIARGEDETGPASLDALPNIRSVASCPIGHEAYLYDPATGAVKCPHPGHGKY